MNLSRGKSLLRAAAGAIVIVLLAACQTPQTPTPTVPAPSPTPEPAPFVTLVPDQLSPGAPITVVGSDWFAGEQVTLGLVPTVPNANTGTSVLAVVTADGQGRFQLTAALPTNLVPGVWQVYAQTSTPGRFASATMTVLQPTALPPPPTQTPVTLPTLPPQPTRQRPPARPTNTPLPAPSNTPIPTPVPPVFPDWRGDYFANSGLAGLPALVRNDPLIDFDWGYGSPDARIPADNFSVRWTRSLSFNPGTYRFVFRVDDGVRMYIDNVLMLDDWRDGSPRDVYTDVTLVGRAYNFRVEYYERTGTATIRFNLFRLPEGTRTPLPTNTPSPVPPPTFTPPPPPPTQTPIPIPTAIPPLPTATNTAVPTAVPPQPTSTVTQTPIPLPPTPTKTATPLASSTPTATTVPVNTSTATATTIPLPPTSTATATTVVVNTATATATTIPLPPTSTATATTVVVNTATATATNIPLPPTSTSTATTAAATATSTATATTAPATATSTATATTAAATATSTATTEPATAAPTATATATTEPATATATTEPATATPTETSLPPTPTHTATATTAPVETATATATRTPRPTATATITGTVPITEVVSAQLRGDQVRVAGTGWVPNERLTISVTVNADGSEATQLGVVRAGRNGRFAFTSVLSTVPEGDFYAIVTNDAGDKVVVLVRRT